MQIYSGKTLSTSNMLSAIEVNDVTVNYGKHTALRDVSFKLDKGSLLYVVGPNGSGKTTLIKLLVGLINPTHGKVSLNSDSVGYLPQKLNHGQNFPITVKEVIYSGFKKQSLVMLEETMKLIKEWLERMEISHLLDKLMSNLSGGEQQRIFLIRALINNPDVLIMDEPTSALDPIAEAEIYENFNNMIENKTAIYISHRMSSSVFCDKILIINNGEIGDYDSHKNLMNKPDSLYYKLFNSQAINYKI